MQSTIRITALLAALLALAATAHAETTECTEITSVRYIITTPGVYCLKRRFSGTGRLIEINADDVTVDFNGHVLVLDINTATGVSASNRSNITVRNGTIRGGGNGISLGGNTASGNLVEQMRIEGAVDIGISVTGRGTTVRNNVLVGIGGGTPAGARYGISATGGAGIRVSGNQVLDTGVGYRSVRTFTSGRPA
jgi:hypothetical protein